MSEWGRPRGVPPPPETLRALDLRGIAMVALFDWIQLPIQVLHLHSAFHTYYHPNSLYEDQFHPAVRYIHSLGPALQSLDLTLVFWKHAPADLKFLQANTQLRALSVRADPSLTLAFLEKTSFPPQLETLTIVMKRYLILRETWQEFDRTFAPTAIQRLHIVHLEGGVNETRMLEAFPLCVARGMVVTQSKEVL